MIQVGKKVANGVKTQIFVEPAAKRMDFDRGGKDIHPMVLFTSVVAEFKDTTSSIVEKSNRITN